MFGQEPSSCPGKLFWSKFDISMCCYGLGQGHQNLINSLSPPSIMYLCKFGQIHPLVQEIGCGKGCYYSLCRLVTLKIRSRSQKSDYMYTGHNDTIYQVWPACENKILVKTKCHSDLENKVMVTNYTPVISNHCPPPPTHTHTPTGNRRAIQLSEP